MAAAKERSCSYEVPTFGKKPSALFVYDFTTKFKYASEDGRKYNTERFLMANPPRFRFERRQEDNENYWSDERFDMASKSLISKHCLFSTVDLKGRIPLWYADRNTVVDISDAPVDDAVVEDVRLVKRLSMQTLDIGASSAPDWLDLMSAQVVRSGADSFLRVKLHNTGKDEVREHSLKLNAYNSMMWCMSEPTTADAELVISSANGVFEAKSTDLIFGNLVNLKNVKTTFGPCGEIALDFKLGELPPIQPDQDYYINFRVSVQEGEAKLPRGDFFAEFPYLTVTVEGSRVFPDSVRITP